MQSEAGVVMTAVVGLWIAYFVPHRLRYRQQLLESRAGDRFSDQLRVVRVTAAGPASRSAREDGGLHRVAEPTRVLLHPPSARRGGGGTMDRPHAAAERVAADAVRRSAAEHARRVAHLQQRRAAARRRALLTVVLLAATVAGWASVAAGTALAFGLVPLATLGGVLLLGRRAVVSAAKADAAWAAGAAGRVPLPAGLRQEVVRSARPAVVGRAVRPSEARTEVLDRVPVVPTLTGALDRSRTAVSSEAVDVRAPAETPVASHVEEPAEVERTWSPVPVPRPAYTLKAAAPRREPAPLPASEPAHAEATHAENGDAGAATETTDGAPGAATARTPQGVGGMDLDQILARRRASGE